MSQTSFWRVSGHAMETLFDIWPFVPGQQRLIFNFAGVSVIGLIAVNVFSAFRQGLPISTLLSGLFVAIPGANRMEKILRVMLWVWLTVGFLALVIDTQVNGVQLVDIESMRPKYGK